MSKNSSFQQQTFGMMKEVTGTVNSISVPRLFCEAMGGLTGGTFLAQLIYWCDKGASGDGWIYKTTAEWTEETYLSGYEITKSRKILEDAGVLETVVKKANGNPTLHYKLLREPFRNWLLKFFNNDIEKLKKGNSNVSNSITKTTTKPTAKNTTTEWPKQPPVVPVIFKNTEGEQNKEIHELDLPAGITQQLLVNLTKKYAALHGPDIVHRQLINLKREIARNTVESNPKWLTNACKLNYPDSDEHKSLFAKQENKQLEIKLVEKLESESNAPHDFVNPDFMNTLIEKYGCIREVFVKEQRMVTNR